MSLDLKRQLIAQLVESSRLLRNYIDNRAKGRGTTRAQWIVLFRLRQQEGLSQVDLADVLELQPISLVRLLDRLDDGWKPYWLDTLAIEPGQTQRIAFPAEYPGRYLIESVATDWAAPRLVRWYSVV